jgi:hypothetical protein
VTFPPRLTDIDQCIRLARTDAEKSDPDWLDLFGGVKFDASDPQTYWHKASQFQTFYKVSDRRSVIVLHCTVMIDRR